MKLSRILCPVDFSEFSVKAYEYAQALAARYRAQLYLLHVQHPDEVAYAPYMSWAPSKVLCECRRSLLHAIESRLEEFAAAHGRNGIRPHCLAWQGTPSEYILSFARDSGVDLMVMGTHGRQGLERLTQGSVTERVLREAPCPVLVIRKPTHDFVAPENLWNPVPLHRILCCVDLSGHSEKALDHAQALSEEYGAELTVTHVLESNGTTTGARAAQVKQQLEQLLSRGGYRKCPASRATVRMGRVCEQIIRAVADTRADLTVMGVRDHRALGIRVLNSTTTRVIQLGSCPVLAVHA